MAMLVKSIVSLCSKDKWLVVGKTGISEVGGNQSGHGVSSSGMGDSTGGGSSNMPQQPSSSAS